MELWKKITYRTIFIDFALMLANKNVHLNDGGEGDCPFSCTGIFFVRNKPAIWWDRKLLMIRVHPNHISYHVPEFALLMLNVDDYSRRGQMYTYLVCKETLA